MKADCGKDTAKLVAMRDAEMREHERRIKQLEANHKSVLEEMWARIQELEADCGKDQKFVEDKGFGFITTNEGCSSKVFNCNITP